MYSLALMVELLATAAANGDPRGQGVEGADYVTLEVSALRCVVGNNKSAGTHRPGYNGIFAMTVPGRETSAYVPSYAGVNLEHFFDARGRNSEAHVFFEPRYATMRLERLGDRAVELHQPPTPAYGVESWTRFEVKEPNYVDFSCRLVPRKEAFEGGFIGVFWASYINQPEDKSIYFLAPGATFDKPRWLQLCTQQHDRDSTVLQENDPATVAFEEDSTSLFNSFSPLRFSEPFFYGRVRDMVLIYIFEPNPGLRIAHSPSGGGSTPDKTDTCPAWDFQLVIPEYEVGAEYALNGRVVYKPWAGRTDVLTEARKFLGR